MILTPQSLGLPPKFTSFRPEVGKGQDAIIADIVSSPCRISVLQAPPGSGKTVIAIASALALGVRRTLYLTKTKSLQSQLSSDFSAIGLVDIVGHSSYPCASLLYVDDELADMECTGRRGGDGGSGGCHYRRRVLEALGSRLVSTNYAHAIHLAKVGQPDRLGSFDYLILDEAHSLPTILADYCSIVIQRKQVQQWLSLSLPSPQDSIEHWLRWAQEAKRSYDRAKLDTKVLSVRDRVRVDRLKKSILRLLTETNAAEWVIYPLPQNRGIQLKPTNPIPYLEPYLLRNIPRILLISGTIFKEDVTEVLGFDLDGVQFINIDSTTDPRNRPIIYYPTVPPIRADRSMGPGEERIWLAQIDAILDYERVQGTKGLIQSRSYERADLLAARLRNRSSVISYDKNTAADALAEFRSAPPPCTLVGPTLEEGIDLPGPECEYILFPKVPFLWSKDPYTRAMAARYKGYSNREVARSIIQASLRGLRSAKDRCRIWMIDWHWTHFRNQPYFYLWYRRGYKQISGLGQVIKWK